MQYFNELKLPLALEKAIQAMRFEKPTPIQAQAIPVALKGCDLIGCAQTGTGKTVAFSVPVLTRLLNAPQSTALILVPTRELAAQVAGVISKLTAFSPQLRSVLLIGGVAMQPQTRNLQRNPQIVIATPGRLIDHLNQKNISLAATGVLVLDEADRMLDMGFAPQLSQILRHLPNARQTLCFSATFSTEMEKLAARFLKNPERVTIGAVSQPAQAIEQSIVQTTSAKKNDTLMDELNARQGSVLVFARTQHRTDRVARYLESYGHTVTRLHGGRTQGQRNTAVSGFRDGRFRIMVATDIAARGIDISHIAHVINYDLPQVPEDYVHRIGRTGRAGAKGEAVSLITQEDQAQWREIVRMLKKTDKVPAKTRIPQTAVRN
jgi:superfamily II DNA/RNA helicase